MKAKWRHILRTESPEIEAAPSTQVVAVEPITPQEFSKAVDAALAEPEITMSSAEAQARRLAVLLAAAFIAEQMRALSNARIEDRDEAAVQELENAMGKLTSQPTIDSLNRMLEARPELVNPEVSTELLRLFGGGTVMEGQYVPIANEKLKDALRLTNEEPADGYKPGYT